MTETSACSAKTSEATNLAGRQINENRGRYMERFDEARAGIVLRDAPPIEMIQVASDRRLDRAI